MTVVDLAAGRSTDREAIPGVVVVVGTPDEVASPDVETWLERASFTLTESPSHGSSTSDRRVVAVASIPDAIEELEDRCRRWPLAAAVCDDVVRSVDAQRSPTRGVITGSLAYSTLQAGPEFARWLVDRGPADVPAVADPVLVERAGDRLIISFNRPRRHNAFSTDARAALLEALAVAHADESIDEVVLRGNGPSFCSGGDLAEFGSFTDPASAHLARTRHSPALSIAELTQRLGPRCRAVVHGQVLGSGLEMASFFGHVDAHPDSIFGLPELGLGLLPGAGGTVSVTRRIGRWRTGYLVLSGRTIDAPTAAAWGLVDALTDQR